MKKIIIFLIIIIVIGIGFGVYQWQKNKEVTVRIEYLECWGCGCEIYIVKKEDAYPPGKKITGATIGIAAKCLEKYPEKEDSLHDDYLLNRKEIKELKDCVKQLEKERYCQEQVDCCTSVFTAEECPYRCVDNYCQEIGFIKVEDIYGEFPIYYDKFVEFEGYVTSVYECLPCPSGAECERCLEPYFLVYKEPLPYRYYSTGQVIVKHRFGEKPEEGKKYRIRGRLLPPEQAYLIEIIGTLPNVELRVVIEPTEPALEIK